MQQPWLLPAQEGEVPAARAACQDNHDYSVEAQHGCFVLGINHHARGGDNVGLAVASADLMILVAFGEAASDYVQ